MARSSALADAKREKIVKLVQEYDLSSDQAWSALDELSTHTALEGLEVDPEGIVIDKRGKFRGVVNVYVTLKYDEQGVESFATSESFLGNFEGHFEGERPKIDSISVDTSSFYQ